MKRCTILLLCSAIGLLAQPGPQERVAVLIGFNNQPGPAEQALVRAFGGTIKHSYQIIPAVAATLPAPAVAALSNNPAISVIEPDTAIFALDEYDNAWGVKKIAAKVAHDASIRGAGLKVCVLDSGIDTNHPDLAVNYEGGYDYVNNDSDPSDDNGHGTHVAGTVGAALNSIGVVGVAPSVRILAYKILNASGSGDFSDVIAALDDCRLKGGKITSNSYGSGGDPGSLVKAAFDNSYNAGLLHVAASGNASFFTCNSVSYPAKYSSVVAVAATNSSDGVAAWSCRGPEVEVAAPGVSIQSTYPNDTYAVMSGTSMATPHVSGLAALVFGCGLVDQNGDGVVNNVDVRLRMQRTALDLGTAGRDIYSGFGRVRADVATTGCTVPPPPVTVPIAPSELRVTARERSYIDLAWKDNSNNEANFELWRCRGTGCTSFARVATLPANTTSTRNSGLSRSTTYRFKVRGINSAGFAESNIVTTTTR